MIEEKNDKTVETKKKISAAWITFGVIVSLTVLTASVVFSLLLYKLGILPNVYHYCIWGSLAGINILLLVIQFRNKTKIISKIFSVLIICILILGIFLLNSALQLLQEVSDVTISTNAVVMYVKTEDSAQSLTNVKNYNFGILSNLGRDNTDKCIDKIEKELDRDIKTTEYDSISELAFGLLDNEVDAIIVNNAYLYLLDEEESLRDFANNIRSIWYYEIQRELNDNNDIIGTNYNIIDDTEFSVTKDAFAVYISGNDTSGTLAAVGRSDVNIIMVVNPSTNEILLVNTPRDYFVELPVSEGERDKLTHAGIYGVDVSMGALAQLYDIPVRYYVRLNFSGFMNIIDALGGITVHSDVAFTVAEWNYVVGENELSGIEALAFARERYSFESGDRQRGKNQAAVIKAVIQKAASPALLANYMEFMDAAAGTVETNMSHEEIASLVQMQLTNGGDWSITSISVDGFDSMGPCYSLPSSNVYRMIPDQKSVEDAIDQINDIFNNENSDAE